MRSLSPAHRARSLWESTFHPNAVYPLATECAGQKGCNDVRAQPGSAMVPGTLCATQAYYMCASYVKIVQHDQWLIAQCVDIQRMCWAYLARVAQLDGGGGAAGNQRRSS